MERLFPGAMPVGEMEDAATSGKVWRVKEALNEGADPNELSAMFGTALHAAVEGHVEIVQLLVQQGADPQRRDDEGQTPADVAAASEHRAVAAYLNAVAAAGAPSATPGDAQGGLLQRFQRWFGRRG